MFTTEFMHDVQSITLRRDKVNTDTYGITLVIKTESGEKTVHLFSSEPVEIEGVTARGVDNLAEAYKAGFVASSEGYNGEQPFDGLDPSEDETWRDMRDGWLIRQSKEAQ